MKTNNKYIVYLNGNLYWEVKNADGSITSIEFTNDEKFLFNGIKNSLKYGV